MTGRGDLSFINEIKELDAMPSLIVEVMDMLSNSVFESQEVAEKIMLDTGMTSFVLKFCNSPFLGLQHPVVNLQHALDLIGPSTVKSVLMSYFLRQIGKSFVNKEIAIYLWEHSVIVGIIAKELAGHLNFKQLAEEAYLAGLMHDIGKMVIYLHDPKNYEGLLLDADMQKKSIFKMEHKFYGYSHVETGYYLLDKWRFPRQFKDTIRYHYHIENYHGNEEVVKLAAFANSTFHYAISRKGKFPQWFLKEYKLSEKKFLEILDSLLTVVTDSQSKLMALS